MVKITKYKYGFEYKGLLYGWLKKKLYRLPCEKSLRNYTLKELDLIAIGNNIGYRICRDRKSLKQLSEMTKEINYDYKYYTCWWES